MAVYLGAYPSDEKQLAYIAHAVTLLALVPDWQW